MKSRKKVRSEPGQLLFDFPADTDNKRNDENEPNSSSHDYNRKDIIQGPVPHWIVNFAESPSTETSNFSNANFDNSVISNENEQ